jgi:hypothetical protein
MSKENKTTVSESDVRPSISLRLIRHAESNNNEVYRNARYIYRGGTPEFDEPGWFHYVETNRNADPCLSKKGYQQAHKLASYMVPHLENQASHPVRIVTSPMRRTLETIQPTLEMLRQEQSGGAGSGTTTPKAHIIVNAFYHESEGCHVKDQPEEGMNPAEIRELLKNCVDSPEDIEFVGFPQPDRGWYIDGTGPETRAHSERRAAKFYLWLCEYLDEQLSVSDADLFDAGVQIEGEEAECEHDKFAQRIRRRRTALFIGHGDFMSLVIKRIIAGYGHYVETEGIPHRKYTFVLRCSSSPE